MKKIKSIIITYAVIIITMLINLLINQTSFAQTQMHIIPNKEIITKDEEINIKVQIVDTPIATCTLEIYFDSSKLEYIKGPENSNYSNNRIIYTWVSSTGKNEQGIETENFKFKVLQEENTNIAVFGEFYNEQGEKLEIDNSNIELKTKQAPNNINQITDNIEQTRSK
ncbi:MAG: hypothetical protein HFJ41_02065 [Clostridia bacterium]|nr:hypothetical protein [Clostridia bacterium]